MRLPEALPRVPKFSSLKVDHLTDIVREAATVLLEQFPETLDPDSSLKGELLEHGARHLEYLDLAVTEGDDRIFVEYAVWIGRYLVSRGMPKSVLREHLAILVGMIARDQNMWASTELWRLITLDETKLNIEDLAEIPPTWDKALDEACVSLLKALLRGDRAAAVAPVSDRITSGMPPLEVYERMVKPVMVAIGRLWESDDITYLQEHTATATLPAVLAHCRVAGMREAGIEPHGTIVLTGVDGELHEVGLHVLTDVLHTAGWHVRNLGPNNTTETVLEALRQEKPKAIGISITMATNLPVARDLIAAINADKLVGHCPIIVGGDAFRKSDHAWFRIGADLYASTPRELLKLLSHLESNPDESLKGNPEA